jgi:hypothetical protein
MDLRPFMCKNPFKKMVENDGKVLQNREICDKINDDCECKEGNDYVY